MSPVPPPRVVLDTNIVLSALLFPQGPPAELRRAWQDGQILPLLARPGAEELLRTLHYPKFRLTAQDREDLLADYLPYSETVSLPDPPPGTPECRDPHDLPFLQAALAGRADALVTGDRDLLALAPDFPVPLVTASEFLAGLEKGGGADGAGA